MLSPGFCGALGSEDPFQFGRRVALAGGAGAVAVGASPSSVSVDTTITDRVFLSIGICQNNERPTCSDAQPLGRILIGLYGNQVPQTSRLFKAMCTGAAGSSYQGTVFHKVIKGRYIQAGHQGSREKGEVPPPAELAENLDTVSSKAFLLSHTKPGTVSLCLAENDDDEAVRLNPDYRNVEFMITTGPAPVPDLDSRNIVFGTVLQGLDVVAAVAAMPTFKPSERVREFNKFAQILGDDRATNARGSWFRPLRPVVITECGEEV